MISNLTELVSASEAKAVADTAEHDHQVETIAYAINTAANTGCTEVMINQPIYPEIISQLTGLGYLVTPAGKADAKRCYLIAWTTAEPEVQPTKTRGR